MKTRAVRLYGANDLRMEHFDLPPIKEDEILVKIISDSICMSTYKETMQGTSHKRVPKDIAVNPIIIGHEFAGEIIQVGRVWQESFAAGQRFSVQPNINYLGKGYAPGYSFPFCGGAATFAVLPREVMEKDCLLCYEGEGFYAASLAEPVSCLVAGFKAFYHTDADAAYNHHMGLEKGGKMAILAGCGPMGLGAIDLALHGPRRPALLVVTDISDERLKRAEEIFSVETAKKAGISLRYVNTATLPDPIAGMRALTGETGFDDVMAFAPVGAVLEMADAILGFDGCLNFFAGPTDKAFAATVNYYNVHYLGTHICGTSGGNTRDMRDALDLAGSGAINPAVMITHILGLDHVAETTSKLPSIPGGKKLSYTHIDLPLTAISDFAKAGETDPRFKELDRLCREHAGLWNAEAERYLLSHF